MGSSRFALFALLRVALLGVTLWVVAALMANTSWYATTLIAVAAVIYQWFGLLSFVNTSNREIGRLLTAIEYEDLTQTFSDRGLGGTFRELAAGLTRVVDKLRATRKDREEQAHYLRTLVEHIPVALLAVEDGGRVSVLNSAARRLLGGGRFEKLGDLAAFGDDFARTLQELGPGRTVLVRMERRGAILQLKAAAAQVLVAGVPRRILSLQNIESELNANELAAWQALIRVLTHEMMNSLTPVSSLAGTAHALVDDLRSRLADRPELKAEADDISEALDTVARRSAGLLHFVQSYRRLTKNLVPNIERVPVRRVFSRLHRLLEADLRERGVALTETVEPETLEISVDAELLDQALINLVRNAADALKGRAEARVALRARLDEGGGVAISVSDNGPGIDAALREKIFVPFFTTKRAGTGVGLSLTRQIVQVHDGAIDVSDTPGGGATFTLRLS
ncbi:MAG: PAS domain-containing protein [Alphaproteobacteria bacterium]|nr:PAS domain-containing protein [Alphaproteobacteria bacterium]